MIATRYVVSASILKRSRCSRGYRLPVKPCAQDDVVLSVRQVTKRVRVGEGRLTSVSVTDYQFHDERTVMVDEDENGNGGATGINK